MDELPGQEQLPGTEQTENEAVERLLSDPLGRARVRILADLLQERHGYERAEAVKHATRTVLEKRRAASASDSD